MISPRFVLVPVKALREATLGRRAPASDQPTEGQGGRPRNSSAAPPWIAPKLIAAERVEA